MPRTTSPAALFVESELATVGVGRASQLARAIMLAAKNNRRHLDLTPFVQMCAVLRLLNDTDPGIMIVGAEVLAGKRSQLVKSLGARFALRLALDFIMAGEAGISDMKSHADEKSARGDDQPAKKSRT